MRGDIESLGIGVDGSTAFGIGFCRGGMSGGMDGVEVGGAESGVDGRVDSCVDGGALCAGATDHLGYESDFLGYGGTGLSGRSGDGKPK